MQLKHISPKDKFILTKALTEPETAATVYEKTPRPSFAFELLLAVTHPDKHAHCQIRLRDREACFISEDTEVIILDLKH